MQNMHQFRAGMWCGVSETLILNAKCMTTGDSIVTSNHKDNYAPVRLETGLVRKTLLYTRIGLKSYRSRKLISQGDLEWWMWREDVKMEMWRYNSKEHISLSQNTIDVTSLNSNR